MPRTSKNSSSQSINILQDLQVKPQTSNGKAKKITSSMYFLDEEPDYSDSDEDFFNIRGKEPIYGEYIYITKPVRKNCNVEVQCDILTIEKSLDAFVIKCAELDPNTVGRYKQLVLLCKELVNDRYLITSDPYHCDTDSDAERIVPQVRSLEKPVKKNQPDSVPDAAEKIDQRISVSKKLSSNDCAFDENEFRRTFEDDLSRSSENLKVRSEKEEEEISANNLTSINSTNKEQKNKNSEQTSSSNKSSAFEEKSDSHHNKQESRRSIGNLGVISETDEKEILTNNLEPINSRNKEENNRKSNQKRLSTKNSAFEEESDSNGNKQKKSKRSNGNLGVVSETNEEDISTDNLKPNKSTNKEQNDRKSNQKRLSTKNSAFEEESDSNGNKQEKSKRSKFNVGCVSESDEEEISTQNVERIPSTNKKNKRTKLESLKFIIGSSLFGKKRDSRRLSTSEKTEYELRNRDKSSKIIEPTKSKVIQRRKRKSDENKLAENKENDSDGNKEEPRRSHNGNLSETELDRTSVSSKKIKLNTPPDCVKMVDSSETDLKGKKSKRERLSKPKLKGESPPKPKLKRTRPRKTELSNSTERQSNDEFVFKHPDCPQMAESSKTDLNDRRSKRGVPRKTDSCVNYNSNSTEITNTTDEENRKTHDTVLIDSSKMFMLRGKRSVEPEVVKPLARNWYNPNKSFSVLEKSLVVDRRFLSLQLPKTRKLYSPSKWLESMSRSP